MRARTIILALLISASLLLGRHNWDANAWQAKTAIAADVQDFNHAETLKQLTTALDDIRDQVELLHSMSWKCMPLLKCSPFSSRAAIVLLGLETRRVEIFEQMATIADKLDSLEKSDPLSVDIPALKLQFEELMFDYRKIYHEIELARGQGVPPEISQALEPLH